MKRTNRFQLNFLFLAIFIFVLTSCSPTTETSTTLNIEASATGPFFSGPNSLIAEYEVDLASIEGLEGVSADQLKEIKIKSVNVMLIDTSGTTFDAYKSASLQMVSANTDMQTVAIKNPIDSNTRELTLQVSDDADIVDYFKGQKFSFVLDLDFIEDSFEEESVATINMEINVKHK